MLHSQYNVNFQKQVKQWSYIEGGFSVLQLLSIFDVVFRFLLNFFCTFDRYCLLLLGFYRFYIAFIRFLLIFFFLGGGGGQSCSFQYP